MDIQAIFSQSWRITWRTWQLWLLVLGLFVMFIPAVVLGGAYGALATVAALPHTPDGPFQGIEGIRSLPAWSWILLAVLGILFLILTSAASWLLQAACMRTVAMAADGRPVALSQALVLGRERIWNILKLSIGFGLLIGVITLLPLALIWFLPGREAGFMLMNLAQAGLAPLNSVLGITLLLVMMSIALEDLRPRMAFRQAWRVFRSGWWGFLLVLVVTMVASFGVILFLLPVFISLPFALVTKAGWLIPLFCGLTLGPPGLFLLIFTGVFTLVLYTLVYRAASAGVAR